MNQAVTDALRGHSLAVATPEGIRTFDGRGVADLYRLLSQDPQPLKGASVADKVVGRAAAALMMAAGVRELYAQTVSELALDMLHGSGIGLAYGRRVPHILNRAGTGWCPLEAACRDCSTPEQCLAEIEKFIKSR